MTDFLHAEKEKIVEILLEIMREAPKKFFIFSYLAKFDKRWSTIMIMLDSSEWGVKYAELRH